MAEFLYATSHLEGNFENPGNALGDTPSTWAGVLNNNQNRTSRWAIGDPVDPLTSEATQTIRVVARKGSNSGTPTIALNLYENGTLVGSILAATNVTSTSGQTLTATFNSSAISNRNDVEIQVVMSAATGSGSVRNSAQVSHIEWEADTTEGPEGDDHEDEIFDSVGVSDGGSWALSSREGSPVGITDSIQATLIPGDGGFKEVVEPSSSLTTSVARPRKPIWFHDGHWFVATGGSGSGYFIHRRDPATGEWTEITALVGQNTRRLDVQVDPTTGDITFYGWRSTTDDHNVGKSFYNAGTNGYGGTVLYGDRHGDPALPNWGGGNGGVSHAIDSQGRMWALGDEIGELKYMVLDPDEFDGGDPILEGPTLLDDDLWEDESLSRVVAFTDSVGPSIGVIVDDQVSDEMRFWVHRDSSPLDSGWSMEVIDDTPETADDHGDVIATPDGEVLACWKAETSGSADPNLMYARRTTAGAWVDVTVAAVRFGSANVDEFTRPVIQYDPGSDTVYLVARSRATDFIHVFSSPRLNPDFTEIDVFEVEISNVAAAAAPLVGPSELVAIGNDDTTVYAVTVDLETVTTRTIVDDVGMSDAGDWSLTEGSERVGLTDSIEVFLDTGADEHDATVFDGVGVSDLATRALEAERPLADGVGLSDAVTAAQEHVRPRTDGVGLSDAVTAAQEHVRELMDGVGIFDSREIASTARRALSELIGLQDSPETAHEAHRGQSDALSVSDEVSTAADAPQEALDGVGVSDTASREVTYLREVFDGIGLRDDISVDAEGQIARNLTDQVGVTDAGSWQQGSDHDPVGISDTVSYDLFSLWERELADSVGITDSGSAQPYRSEDPVGITDSVSYVLAEEGQRIVFDQVGIVDSGAFRKSAPDGVGISDSVSYELFTPEPRLIEVEIFDGIGVGDGSFGTSTAKKVKGPTKLDHISVLRFRSRSLMRNPPRR